MSMSVHVNHLKEKGFKDTAFLNLRIILYIIIIFACTVYLYIVSKCDQSMLPVDTIMSVTWLEHNTFGML